jgi:hypothetical protein
VSGIGGARLARRPRGGPASGPVPSCLHPAGGDRQDRLAEQGRGLPYGEAIRHAIVTAQGVEPLLYPRMGGSLPNYVFTKILGIPSFVVPYANADQANHAPNENLTIECFLKGIRTGAALLTEIGGR